VIFKINPIKILTQEKIMLTSGANSDHKHNHQNSEDSVIVNCQ